MQGTVQELYSFLPFLDTGKTQQQDQARPSCLLENVYLTSVRRKFLAFSCALLKVWICSQGPWETQRPGPNADSITVTLVLSTFESADVTCSARFTHRHISQGSCEKASACIMISASEATLVVLDFSQTWFHSRSDPCAMPTEYTTTA